MGASQPDDWAGLGFPGTRGLPCRGPVHKEKNNTEEGGVQRGRAAVTCAATAKQGGDLDCTMMTHGPCAIPGLYVTVQ